ncbi:MAG: hypothetical protein AB7G28_20120 [Pirellulales bacterium]
MSELLQEYVDSGHQTLRVDRSAGVIRGVKLLGLRSKNGRRYQENALAEAVALYEGAKVNINHPKGHPLSPRDYQDRLGVISGVEYRPQQGLFGDLHFNPKHALSEQLMWDAEHASQNVGLSHNVLARTTRTGDETVVEAITKVQSIDLVADPATTQGLFEQQSPTVAWDALTIEVLELHRPDLVRELQAAQTQQLEHLQSQLDDATARAATHQRHQRIIELLEEHHLPLPGSRDEAARRITSESFVAVLYGAADDAELKQLVEERAAVVRSAGRWKGDAAKSPRPMSRDQQAVIGGVAPVRTAQEFAAAICAH